CLGELDGAVQELAGQVVLELIVRVEVQRLLGELVEEAELVDRPLPRDTGKAHPVDPATILGKQRQLTLDGADVLRGAVEVTSLLGRTNGTRNSQSFLLGFVTNGDTLPVCIPGGPAM